MPFVSKRKAHLDKEMEKMLAIVGGQTHYNRSEMMAMDKYYFTLLLKGLIENSKKNK